MGAFSPINDADLARARTDPAFRRRLLEQSLEMLLDGMKRLRKEDPSGGANAGRLREGVELAVRLAEIIQNGGDSARNL
jgi:hypothetical protein